MLFSKRLFFAAIILLASCKTQQLNTPITSAELTSNLEKKLGLGANQKNNFDDTYVLGWREDNTSGTLVVRYGVWEIKTGALIYANTTLRGGVQWLDNNSLLVEEYLGTVDDGTQIHKFKIDLNTKIKIPLSENEK
jgi:hypothetical protein